MDNGYSTVRNLLLVVLTLAVLAVLSNLYVAQQLSRNSDELAALRQALRQELMGEAMTRADELQKKMDSLNETASGLDGKLKKSQDDFVARMQVELPKIMDDYVRARAPMLQKSAEQQLQKRGLEIPKE